MKNIKTGRIIVACLAAMIFMITIFVVDKIRADRANGVDVIETPVITTNAPTVTPTVAPTVTPTIEPTVAPTEAPIEEGDFTRVDDRVFVNTDKVNLRSEPSAESEIIAEVNNSTLLRRTGIATEWSRVKYYEQECYISNEFISEQIPEVTPDPNAPSSAADVGVNGKVVVIDPGHQGHGDSNQEPIGPGAQATKARVTSGTTGSVSGWAEFELNLDVSLKLRDELVRRGYTVYMTRETHDVSISNKERADFATSKGGDILVRIHANGSDNSSVNGALCMAPTDANQFLAANLIKESQRLSQCVIDNYCANTPFGNQGVYPTDEMSGINWSTMPVTIVEMGYMTNASDDANMADQAMQVKMVKGICDGIDSYFAGNAS